MAVRPPQFAAKAKRVIYLHMSGAPPQQDLFDYKPELVKHHLKPCPDSLLKNERFAFIKGHPKLLGTPHKFAQYGQSGAWVSEMLPAVRTARGRGRASSSRCTPTSSTTPPAELLLCSPARRATAGRRWGRGSRMGWARRARICPASSC